MSIRVGFIKKGRCFVPVIGRICIGECFSCRVIEMDVSPRVGIAMGVSPRVGIEMGVSPRVGIEMDVSPSVGIAMGVSPRVGIAMDVSPRVGIAMETQKSDALSFNDRVVDSPEQLTNVLVSGVNHPFHPSGGVFGSALPDSELLRDGAGVVPGGGASSRFGFWW